MFWKRKNLSEEELLTYLGHDWYHVDIGTDGSRMLQIMGYAFESVDKGEGPYRIVEYGWCYFDPNGVFDLEESKRSVESCGKERVLAYLSNIASLPRLPFNEVNEKTQEGYYCS